jgi:hypothetical protein
VKAATLLGGQEGIAAKSQNEQAEGVFGCYTCIEKFWCTSGQIEDFAKVDLEKILCHRQRVLVIKPPMPPVGENAPRHPALGDDAGTLEIMHDLGGRHALISRTLPVQRSPPAFGLDQSRAVTEALPRFQPAGGGIGGGIREQQRIRHILASVLRQVLLDGDMIPAKQAEKRVNQLLLGIGFGRVFALEEIIQQMARLRPEFGDPGIIQRLPLRRRRDAFLQPICCKQSTLMHSLPPTGPR